MMKICYVIESMYNSGGMERVLTTCANALCNEIDVSILTLYQKKREVFFSLDTTIHRYDLGVEDVSQKHVLKVKLSDFFINHKFDVVISLGGIDMYYIHGIKDGSKKIVWFHFAIDIAKTTWAGPNPSLLRKFKAEIQTKKRIYYAKKYDKIIVISKSDLLKWNKYTKKANYIYNPVTIKPYAISNRSNKYVISVGRLDYQKGYDYLINAWLLVTQMHPDWHLDIYGDGPLRDSLQEQIDNLKLKDKITLCGRSNNIETIYPNYSFYVMSSRAEGLGLVLLEAASSGLPLISFDCPSGPSEIIEDGKNGFLVKKVGDVEGLAEAIIHLIEDDSLRDKMGNESQKTVERFSIENITKQWMEFLMKVIR